MSHTIRLSGAISTAFVAITFLSYASAQAAELSVTSLSTGSPISCSDTVRTSVFRTLSGSIAKIESSASASDAAADKAMTALTSVIGRAGTLAKSAKYASKPSAQCVLAFVAQACQDAKDRIAWGDAIGDALGDDLTIPMTTTTATPTTTALPVTATLPTSVASQSATMPIAPKISTDKASASINEPITLKYTVPTGTTCSWIALVDGNEQIVRSNPAFPSGYVGMMIVGNSIERSLNFSVSQTDVRDTGKMTVMMACEGKTHRATVTINPVASASSTSTQTSTAARTPTTLRGIAVELSGIYPGAFPYPINTYAEYVSESHEVTNLARVDSIQIQNNLSIDHGSVSGPCPTGLDLQACADWLCANKFYSCGLPNANTTAGCGLMDERTKTEVQLIPFWGGGMSVRAGWTIIVPLYAPTGATLNRGNFGTTFSCNFPAALVAKFSN